MGAETCASISGHRPGRTYGVAVMLSGAAQVHDLPTFVIDRRGTVLGAYALGFESEDVLRDLGHLR